MALLATLEIVSRDAIENAFALGEISLDRTLVPVRDTLPANMAAEAVWVDQTQVIEAVSLIQIIQHFNGQKLIAPALPGAVIMVEYPEDLRYIKGQERGKLALEITVDGHHNLLLVGTPWCGKSMLAKRIPSLLPPLTPAQALATSIIDFISGAARGAISHQPPFRPMHQTTSKIAVVGGGPAAMPGEISLAHNGVLFIDGFAEFTREVLECLRQPPEDRDVVVSWAKAHSRYLCQFMLVATANLCRRGYMADPSRACARAPLCGAEYIKNISGPMMDRFDLPVEMPPVTFYNLDLSANGKSSQQAAARIANAHKVQAERYLNNPNLHNKAGLSGALINTIAPPDSARQRMLIHAAELFHLSARSYHRVLRVARTVADPGAVKRLPNPHCRGTQLSTGTPRGAARSDYTTRPQSSLPACLTLQDDV